MAYTDVVLADGPLAYYRLGELSGVNATDSSGGGFTGTYNGTPTLGVPGAMPGDPDTAVTFASASSQYVNCGNLGLSALATAAWSAEYWIKTTGASGLEEYVLGAGNTTVTTQLWGVTRTNGQINIFARDDANTTLASRNTGNININNGSWHHVVGTFNRVGAGNTSIYVDGANLSSFNMTAGSTLTVNAVSIGALIRTTVSNFVNGTVDEAAVYAYALTQAQVSAHYVAGTVGVQFSPHRMPLGV